MANTDDEAPPGPVSGDVFLKLNRVYSAAVQKQGQTGSLVQQASKSMIDAGINMWAAKNSLTLDKMDTAEAISRVISLVAYSVYKGAPWTRQPDMTKGNGQSIEQMFAAWLSPPSEKMTVQYAEDQAEEAGYNMGLKGGTVEDVNRRWDVGSALNMVALRGLKNGLDFMAKSAHPGAVKVTGAKGKRGGREEKPAGKMPAEPAAAPVADETASDGPKIVDMIYANSLKTAQAMLDYYNECCPPDQRKKKFEHKAAGLSALTKLYTEQKNKVFGKQDIEDQRAADAGAFEAPAMSHEAGSLTDVGAEGGEASEAAVDGDGWPIVASKDEATE